MHDLNHSNEIIPQTILKITHYLKTATMKAFLISFLILSSLTGFCQDKVNNKGNWNFGIAFSPDIYFNSKSIYTGSESGYHLDPSGFSFTSGIVGLYSFESKFDIGSGINYSQKAFSGTYYCSVCDFLIAPKPEPISQQFIEIPLFVRYNILDKKFGVHADAGLTSGYLINNIDTQYEGTLTCNRFQFNGQIGLGMNLNLGQRVNLILSSAYNHPFTSFSKGANSNFSFVSIETGFTYRFRENKIVVK
jgi:hypothetical protein